MSISFSVKDKIKKQNKKECEPDILRPPKMHCHYLFVLYLHYQ